MRIPLLLLACLLTWSSFAQGDEETKVDLTFGGFFKLDMMLTRYRNGEPALESPIKDIHFPGAIPAGGNLEGFDTHFHVKETRFYTDLKSELLGKPIHAYMEMDFLLSKAGDERVSNSYNPRLRHAYFEYDKWLFGQTWSTFMIVIIPDDLDFAGAAEGIVFNRQPQIRFTACTWQFSIENPEVTIKPYGGGAFLTSSGGLPDAVIRKNIKGNWGNMGIAAIYRNMRYWDDTGARRETHGFGVTLGSLIKLGERDDFRFQVTYGQGLGRYLALGFLNATVLDTNDNLHTINSINGFGGIRHFWTDKLRSSVNYSFMIGENDVTLTGEMANQSAWSASGNLIYAPAPALMFGVEYMYAYRALEGGTDGSLGRLQFSAKYNFAVSNN